MLYDPSSAVTAERVSWVSRFLTVTATPGSAAPVWSLMIPDRVAEVICAEAARPQDSTRRTRKQPDACHPRAGMVAISTSLSCRDAPLQLLKPVQHDVDLRGGGRLRFDGLQHQEALAVGADIVVGKDGRRRQIGSFEQHPGRSR